jgi:archaemetzincin
MVQQYITLITFGHFDLAKLEKIGNAVYHEFLIPVRVKAAYLDLNDMYDIGRQQYDGNRLLEEVSRMDLPNSIKTVGLFNVDLFIPILTYIFGQAILGGHSSIASMHRLNNVHYGMPEDEGMMTKRFIKEVIHELGHNFGLVHCDVPRCVMRSSTYVEDIDQKSRHFCTNCRTKITGTLQ